MNTHFSVNALVVILIGLNVDAGYSVLICLCILSDA